MKILIAGENLNALMLAKYIKMQDEKQDIYITTDIESEEKYYTPVGIKENEIENIVDFVKYNQIDITITTSGLAIINGIADIFEKERFPIVAPYSEAARITFFNSIAKKVMYKLKINTPRFGIFDRENIADDYIRRAKFPIVIVNDFTLTENKESLQKSYKKAKLELQKIFANGNERIVIENYIDSEPIYIYFLTDGYNAIPLISIERKEGKKYEQIIAPSEKVTHKLIQNILKTAIYPILDDIAKYAGNYSGIIGLKIKIKENNFYILEYYNEFKSYDMQAFLSLLDDDLVSILYETANKQLGDYNYIRTKMQSSYTIAVNKDEIISNSDDEDFYITEDDKKMIITKTASTMNYAKKETEEYIKTICKEETYKEIEEGTKEELRI